MPSKKLIAIVLVALLAVGMGFVVTWGYVHKDADGYYDWDIEYSKSFETEDGKTMLSSAGKTFAIVDVVVKNESYEPGISTSLVTLVWELTLDRMKHEPGVHRVVSGLSRRDHDQRGPYLGIHGGVRGIGRVRR
ncbi:MAG: hypothetical protein A3208_02620 [Candidatus Methanoprimaticola hominis]|nr:MAG: hypothetical protein A3208_02620 [Methanomassiliicoccales archaeon Mx-06]